MAITTHKMLAAAGLENKAQITDQASTLSPNTKTFFDCDEAYPVTSVVDVVNGSLSINNSEANVSVANGSEDGVNVRILAWGAAPAEITGGDFPLVGTNDYILLVMGKAVDGGIDVNDIGHISFYHGDTSTGQMKVQPYYAVYRNTTIALPLTQSSISTPWQVDYKFRVAGQSYMFAGLKRKNILEHYADDKFTGSVDIVANGLSDVVNSWNDETILTDTFGCGHSSYGSPLQCSQTDVDANVCNTTEQIVPGGFVAVPPNSDAISEVAQNYLGFLLHIFPNGAPSQAEIENGMKWMKPRWLNGDKAIYPGWMF